MPVFSLTVFVNALLLFLVQPMIAKLILPTFGGAPSVWTTCMLFFQLVLLAGYAYAHATTSWLGVRRQSAMHAAMMLLSLLFLPIAAAPMRSLSSNANPVFSLLASLAVIVGIPFFMISASAPLVQKWFTQTAHTRADDPYFLYAASNLGSMIALLGYPALIEPHLSLRQQTGIWSIAYGLAVCLVVLTAMFSWRQRRSEVAQWISATAPEKPPELAMRLRWIALATVPSSLMLGVTAYLSNEISPVPLLWVIPLAIYLLSFILVFSRIGPFLHPIMTFLLPPLALCQTFLMLATNDYPRKVHIVVNLLTLSAVAIVCHGSLARCRPSARYLTGYYLCMSIGGALGGIFNALVAPNAFTWTAEYPLALICACLLMPALSTRRKKLPRYLDLVLPLSLGLCCAAWLRRGETNPTWVYGLSLAACYGFAARPLRFGLGLAAVWIVAVSQREGQDTIVYRSRNFFGTIRVSKGVTGKTYYLYHGNIRHGAQNHSEDPRVRRLPLLYYYPTGPAGQIFQAFRRDSSKSSIAVIGLGVGALAGYAEPGQVFTFFEIDPAVDQVARGSELFTFVGDARKRNASCFVVVDDARLALQRSPPQSYGLLVIDAFNGDAIPTHLLTREAIQLYLSHLHEDGLLLFHVTNDYLDLEPVLGNLAEHMHLTACAQNDSDVSEEEARRGKAPSHWVAIARRPDCLAKLRRDSRWREAATRPGTPVWTDDYSNLLSVFRW
jgi:hypothetical protein